MTLGTTLLSLVRSRVVAQLERCGCPILDTPSQNFSRYTCPEVAIAALHPFIPRNLVRPSDRISRLSLVISTRGGEV